MLPRSGEAVGGFVVSVRPIRAISAPGLRPADICKRPELCWVAVDRLVVNERYQREISERSVTLIRRIVQNWSWDRVRPAVVVRLPDATFEVLDGQHLATAAATHGGVTEIPCLVLPPVSIEGMAAAFVGLNRDRVGMTSQQVFRAELEAGDPVCLAVRDGVLSGGGEILLRPPVRGEFKIGQTIAVAALKAVARAKGKAGVARVVRAGIAMRLSPISAAYVQALQALFWAREYAGELEDGAYTAAVLRADHLALIDRAKARAKDLKITKHAALSQLIFQEAS